MGQVRGLVAAAGLTGVVLLGMLAGCAPTPVEPTPSPTPPAEPTTGPQPDPETPDPAAFTLPKSCEEMVGDTQVAAFAADGLDLLGGPGGRYGSEYFAEPTPEEEAGGLTCVWGDEDDVASTIIVSVAPVTLDSRDALIADLLAQGLIEADVSGAAAFGVAGDDVSSPAILNVVRDDSWISVIRARGGEAAFTAATRLVDTVTTAVYSAG